MSIPHYGEPTRDAMPESLVPPLVQTPPKAKKRIEARLNIQPEHKFTPSNGLAFLELFEFETEKELYSMGDVSLDEVRICFLPSYVESVLQEASLDTSRVKTSPNDQH